MRPHAPRSIAGRVTAAFATLGAIVGAIAGVTSLVDWVGDKLNHSPPPPPAVIDGRIQKVTLASSRTALGEYLRDTRQPTEPYEPWQLRQRGLVFNIRFVITGYMGRSLPVRWALYRSPDIRLRGALDSGPVGRVTPNSQKHAATWPAWVPYPTAAGKYFVRFTLQGPDKRPIDERDSPPFNYPVR